MRLYGIYLPKPSQHGSELLWRMLWLAVRLEDVLKVSELSRRQQARKRELSGAACHRNFHCFDSLPGCDSGPLVNEGAAFNGKRLGETSIAEVEMPAIDLQVKAISHSGL